MWGERRRKWRCYPPAARKELPTSQFTDISPGPHGWVPQAQSALDELSAVRTLAEAEARFGSARRLSELVLGFPVSGGHATRRVIRAVGQLLRHPLGPAIAAEALSWAASIADAVDASTIENFLELTVTALGTYRPWRLDDRPAALGTVASLSRAAPKRLMLFELWTHSRAHLLAPDADYRRESESTFVDQWGDTYGDLAAWLEETSDGNDPLNVAGLSPAQQRSHIEGASAGRIDRLARYQDLFEMDEAVIGTCLLRSTRNVLTNAACPQELRDRIRHPYDLATLELALRAGIGCFERARVRRMVGQLDGASLRALVAAEPGRILESLRELGLISADQLLHGGLRGFDLQDRPINGAIFGGTDRRQAIELVTELALRHPQADALVWVLDDAPRGAVPPDAARRLVDAGSPQIARSALRHLPLALLTPSDAHCAAECGHAWLAACPGLSAVERPPLPWDCLGQWQGPSGAATRIWYPEQLLQLEGATLTQAQGWGITLPRNADEIRHNAKVMRNCTLGLIDEILEGSTFLVIAHDPEGRRYNVAITREGRRFVVGHINSWANTGREPAWIRPAFTQVLNEGEPYPPWEDQDRPHRPRTPHRDRRRRRAQVARRRRR